MTPAITAAMAPVWARLADRYGRKLMVARSLVSFVVIMALMAFVHAPWQVLALRAIQGFFAGYGPIAMTMAAESAPPEHMATAIGWVQTAQRLGPALGPGARRRARAQAVGLRQTFSSRRCVYLAARSCSSSSAIARIRARRAAPAADRAAPRDVCGAAPRVPHFVLCSSARSSACSSSIAASGRFCRSICARSARPRIACRS